MRRTRASMRGGQPVIRIPGRTTQPINGLPIGWSEPELDEGFRLASQRLPEPPTDEAKAEATNRVLVAVWNKRLPIGPRISTYINPGKRLTKTEDIHAETIAIEFNRYLKATEPTPKPKKRSRKKATNAKK